MPGRHPAVPLRYHPRLMTHPEAQDDDLHAAPLSSDAKIERHNELYAVLAMRASPYSYASAAYLAHAFGCAVCEAEHDYPVASSQCSVGDALVQAIFATIDQDGGRQRPPRPGTQDP